MPDPNVIVLTVFLPFCGVTVHFFRWPPYGGMSQLCAKSEVRNAFQRISAGNSKQDTSLPLTSQVFTDVLPSVLFPICITSYGQNCTKNSLGFLIVPQIRDNFCTPSSLLRALSHNVKGKSLLLASVCYEILLLVLL